MSSSKNVNPPEDSSTEKSIQGISALKRSFNIAKSVDEMLKAFKKLESCCQETELGLECLQLAEQLHKQGHDPEQVISFGKRALRILMENEHTGTITPPAHGWSMSIGSVLCLLGSVSFTLKNYTESLRYLNWSCRTLAKSVESSSDQSVLHILLDTHVMLSKVKLAMGKKDEVPVHMRKVCEIKEKIVEKGSLELCEAYKDTFCSYDDANQSEEALPFCLKALEAYSKCLGPDSTEVADLRKHLTMLYYKLEESEKGLELLTVALKNTTLDSSDMCKVEIMKGNMLTGLGRYKEAMKTVKPLISHAEILEYDRGCALVSVARTLCGQKKFADAKKFLDSARLTLEKVDMDPYLFSLAFLDIALVYGIMDDLKSSKFVLRRVIATPNIPPNSLRQGCERLFNVVLQTGADEETVTCLKDAVEKMKDSFGPEHSATGYAYLKLGGIYADLMGVPRPLTAVTYLSRGKDILDVSLGPNHLDSLNAAELLSSTYMNLGRYDEAIAMQEKAVKGYEGLGASERGKYFEAVLLLRQMKKVATSTPPSNVVHNEKDILAMWTKLEGGRK